jgi:hypothetical protein
MKRTSFLVALLLSWAVSAFAQIQGGSITGAIKDDQGGVLPGVTVTAQGVDATQTFVTDATGEYRFLNLAPGPYKITATLQGFTTLVREDVIVAVGKNVELPLTLKIATVAETITVTGESPVIDTKSTGTATNFTTDELTKIPTSRDPFALMRSVPGVLVDRVNIGGNETGQQSNFASKGTRPQDAVWTMDGINITDMAATGASPSYYNYDNFEEIQVSTAGQDIKQPTGGMGLNLVVKRGTNQFHGGVRGYFDNESMESDNTPAELKAVGVQHTCPSGTLGVSCTEADHNRQISDYGFDIGGPIYKDRAWFYGSYSVQDVRLVRRAGALIDRTQLKNPDVKLNWQATKKDMVSFLYFDGFKIKDGRSPGVSGILFDAPTATFHQDNTYSDNPFHGLWKIADDRVMSSNMFLSAKFASFNTGFILDPEGGLGQQAGRDFVLAQSFGSVNQSLNIRPQKVFNTDLNSFLTGFGGTHDLKYGFGWRRVDATSGTLWPGNGILALVNSATDLRAQVFRQGLGGNRVNYLNFYVGDTIARDRMTLDLGLRYDRQWGSALPSTTASNSAFPNVVPGFSFPGYDAPFTWNNLSPRAGITYALDSNKKTVVRASFSRYAGQLDTGTVGVINPSSTAGSATYRWTDLNSDHFAQANEVDLTKFITSGGGFNPANPTAITSSNVLDPNLKAPKTTSVVAGIEREVLPNLAVSANYSYTRTTDLFGNFTGRITPRVGVTLADYTLGTGFTGKLPDGTIYNVPTYIPNQAKVNAGGNGFLTTNIPGYSTDYNGIELGATKRLSNRWMGRVAFSWNNPREHFDSASGVYDTNGNPTPTLSEPLKNGGQFAPQSGGSGSGNIYINAHWQFNANALYQGPWGIEFSGNVFGRQGYPFPIFRQGTTAALGADSSLQVLVTPQIDSFRYPNLWNTDLRAAKEFRFNQVKVRGILDCFNVFNANTALVRNNNIGSTSFNTLAQNLSPRIFRVGLVVGF